MPKYYTTAKLSDNIAKTQEGFLLCIGVPVTRTGTFLYGEGETPLETNDDGEILISRDESVIFDINAMASFEGKPSTINHPQEFVTPVTYKNLAVGHMQNIRPGKDTVEVDGKQEKVLLADLLIHDPIAIKLIEDGLREVSLGYEAEYEQTGEGTGKQLTIRGNHIALVEKGRAGEVCAIMDHKGKVKNTMSKVAELLKKLTKVADEEMKSEETPKKEDAKDEGEMAYDEVMKAVKDLGEKIDAMNKPKDAEPKKEEPKKEEKSEDDESSMEDRLKKLEMAVAKLLESKDKDPDADEDEPANADDEEMEDDDFEESSMTGDTAARAEILSPGIKKSKDIKALALKAAYGTKEGKQVIDSISGGKPTFDSAERVNTLFIAASEILKASRGNGLEKTKNAKSFDSMNAPVDANVMTAEKINAINAAKYGLKN